MRSSLDRVVVAVPVSRTAALVTSESRDNFEFTVKPARETFDAPPLMTRDERRYRLLDLRGHKYARLTVIGLAKEQNQKKSSRWVVRCACGKYEFRKARAIRNPENARDCCTQCQQLHREQFRQTRDMYGDKAAERMHDAQSEMAMRQKSKGPMPISPAEMARYKSGAPLPAFLRERAGEVVE
jgi:hypothetical protein